MENTEYKADRSTWEPGPWDNEPEDRVDFLHAGFSCFIKRGPAGAWCGYVGVPEGHSAYGKSYDEVDVEVHGGLTYANPCKGAICHVPAEGMPDKVWWLGFDTAHFGDLVPAHNRLMSFYDRARESEGPFESYKTRDYTKGETERLAEQLERL